LKICAKDIERWAETREAQGELPRLIRRLAVQRGSVTEIAFGCGSFRTTRSNRETAT